MSMFLLSLCYLADRIAGMLDRAHAWMVRTFGGMSYKNYHGR